MADIKSPDVEEYRAAAHDWQMKWKEADDELQKLRLIVRYLNKSNLSTKYLLQLANKCPRLK